MHNGIDTHRFKAAEKSINFESRPLKTISVGRLFPVKQVDQIISWVAAMKESGVDIQHEHAGKGPEMENLVAKVEKLGLEKEFIFKGNVNDVPSFMSTAQLFVHAARFEGCPNVIMEAMACGLPILSSNAGDTSFIVDHGENGYVFEIDDTEAMLSLGLEMASKPDLLATFADNGQIKAKDNFGISQYVKAVREAYSKMKISI
ncbi:MAG: glycosyltransferase [Bacteroidetes bacterium]|nr:glycosyltransferase [Bacteroidota bacterium]